MPLSDLPHADFLGDQRGKGEPNAKPAAKRQRLNTVSIDVNQAFIVNFMKLWTEKFLLFRKILNHVRVGYNNLYLQASTGQ